MSRQAGDVTEVNVSLCLLLTYFTCNRGDDVTQTGSDDVTRQRSLSRLPDNESSSWLQPVIKFVDKLLRNNRRDVQYLQQTLSLVSSLFTLRIGAGTCPEYSFCSVFANLF